MNCQNKISGSKIVVCARAGGANTTPFLAAHFAKRNTKFGGGESEGEAGIHFPPTPFSARLARAFSLAREARRQFRSKKVRISSNKRKNKIFLWQKKKKQKRKT